MNATGINENNQRYFVWNSILKILFCRTIKAFGEMFDIWKILFGRYEFARHATKDR